MLFWITTLIYGDFMAFGDWESIYSFLPLLCSDFYRYPRRFKLTQHKGLAKWFACAYASLHCEWYLTQAFNGAREDTKNAPLDLYRCALVYGNSTGYLFWLLHLSGIFSEFYNWQLGLSSLFPFHSNPLVIFRKKENGNDEGVKNFRTRDKTSYYPDFTSHW